MCCGPLFSSSKPYSHTMSWGYNPVTPGSFLKPKGRFASRFVEPPEHFSSYTTSYSVIYDSGSIPEKSIFSPRETSPEAATKGSYHFHN